MRSIALVALASIAGLAHAGPLDPPAGPVGSSFKTMTEVEPRIAINAVNTPGDATCLYRITQPGSYYLPDDVLVGVLIDLIDVDAGEVTIDLNGFSLQGGKKGIVGIGASNLKVSNGAIRGTSSTGIYAPTSGVRVERVSVESAGGTGIIAGASATISDCSVIDATGIYPGPGSTIRNCSVQGSALTGFVLSADTRVIDCVARNCVDFGFRAESEGTVLTGCIASENGSTGFSAGAGGMVLERCLARQNHLGFDIGNNSTLTDSLALLNDAQGVRVGTHCTVMNIACRSNGWNSDAAGLWVVGSGNRVEGNDLTGNDWGLWVGGTDNIVTRNHARANTVADYFVSPGNEAAPVISNPGLNTFSTANYFSNFSY